MTINEGSDFQVHDCSGCFLQACLELGEATEQISQGSLSILADQPLRCGDVLLKQKHLRGRAPRPSGSLNPLS